MIHLLTTRRTGVGVSLRFLSNTQILGLACARVTSFHATKRRQSRPGVESAPLLNLTPGSDLGGATIVLRHSSRLISVKHIPKKMLTERSTSSATPSTTARASARSLTTSYVAVSHERPAPVPSTAPPDMLNRRRKDLAARPATTSLPCRRLRRTSRLVRSRFHTVDCPAHRVLARYRFPRVDRATYRSLPGHAARLRSTPSCLRAGLAGAWGHPRADADGGARGPCHAAPASGATTFSLTAARRPPCHSAPTWVNCTPTAARACLPRPPRYCAGTNGMIRFKSSSLKRSCAPTK